MGKILSGSRRSPSLSAKHRRKQRRRARSLLQRLRRLQMLLERGQRVLAPGGRNPYLRANS
uniref:hypothetical protein n=1 Tax=Altererythrobacter segetis TaxID=1104773 RepID=UPI00140CA512|nr:hypothetical protein [Altererythrobacter segetis]